MNFETVALDDKNSALVIVDSRRGCLSRWSRCADQAAGDSGCYPHAEVRGAPAIGVAAAIGLYLRQEHLCGQLRRLPRVLAAKDALAATSPRR